MLVHQRVVAHDCPIYLKNAIRVRNAWTLGFLPAIGHLQGKNQMGEWVWIHFNAFTLTFKSWKTPQAAAFSWNNLSKGELPSICHHGWDRDIHRQRKIHDKKRRVIGNSWETPETSGIPGESPGFSRRLPPVEVAARGIEAAQNFKQIVDDLDFTVAAEKVKGARLFSTRPEKSPGWRCPRLFPFFFGGCE